MRPKGFAEEGLTCLHGSITDYLAEKRDEVFPSSLGSEPCSESSHESTSTDLTEENTKDPSMASSTCKKDLQMALPYRPRYNEPTEVTALAGLATQPSKETPPTSNGAYSQPNHIASSRQCDNNDHTGTKKRKTRQSRSKDQPEDSDNIDEDNNDDRRNNRRQGSKGYKGKEVALGLLACPYFKYDSIKYAGEHWRRCCGPGWKDVHRMKEHLYKHHRQPRFLCTRCGLNFQDEVQLRDHTREIKPCVLQQLEPADGFDSKQEERLKSRKRTVTQLPEDEKWKQTYKILFPHIPEELIPSPFYDYVSPNSDVLVGYGEYAHREIQGSFRSVLEREIEVNLGLTEPNSKQKVVDLIEMVNSTLLKNFSNSRGRGSVTPTALHSASTSVVPEISETRLSPVFLTPLSAEQLLLDDGNSALLSNNTTAFADDFGFDFGFYTDGRDLQVMVEPSSNGGSSKPSDSAYGSMSIKDSECSRDSGQHEC
ncbi:hypothetical protein GGR53DRAFT_493232 [Hypoxylon sp. FL1150]|nr:hypothetical protein GGR53DRAFT_493232 [Hypoxylon sp. FL1150]